MNNFVVIPAKAGIYGRKPLKVKVHGLTGFAVEKRLCLRGNDDQKRVVQRFPGNLKVLGIVIPANAGIQLVGLLESWMTSLRC